MKVAFRVDSGVITGSGHLMRCLTLANELKRCGAEIIFICREHPGHLIDKLEEASYFVYRLSAPTEHARADDYATWLGATIEQDAADTLAVLNGKRCDWLVVDHYALDFRWEQQLKPVVDKILVIDDLANRRHRCDVLLDQNYYGNFTATRYKELVPQNCRCLLGPLYALLRPEYAEIRKSSPLKDGRVRHLLVFFGSGDADNQTATVLTALQDAAFSALTVEVVIGVNHPNVESISAIVARHPQMKLHQNLTTLADLMSQADLFIGAGGTTTWERMTLGLPAIVISLAKNQAEINRLLAEDGYQLTLDNGKQISTNAWREAISLFTHMPTLGQKMSQQAKRLVDGFGTPRIVKIICLQDNTILQMRKLRPEDEALLLEWANDPEVRARSFQHQLIPADAHAQWFARKLADPDCHIFIGEDEHGFPMGQVRFELDRKKGTAIIGLSVDKMFRGMGMSVRLLKQAMDMLLAMEGKIKFIAEVFNENQPSLHLFTRLKFTPRLSNKEGAKVFEFGG